MEDKINEFVSKLNTWYKRVINNDSVENPAQDGNTTKEEIPLMSVLQMLHELQCEVASQKSLTMDVTTMSGNTIKAFIYINVFSREDEKTPVSIKCIDSLLLTMDDDDFEKRIKLLKFINTVKSFENFNS